MTLQYKAAPNSKTLPLAFFLADLHNGGHDVTKRYTNDLISVTCFLYTFDTQHIHILKELNISSTKTWSLYLRFVFFFFFLSHFRFPFCISLNIFTTYFSCGIRRNIIDILRVIKNTPPVFIFPLNIFFFFLFFLLLII